MADAVYIHSFAEYVTVGSVLDDLRTIAIPVAVVRVLMSAALMWLTNVNLRFYNNVVIKGDPVPNGQIITMMILFVDLQRFIFVFVALVYFKGFDPSQEVNARQAFNDLFFTRYCTMSMEMLFVIIPIRHNF